MRKLLAKLGEQTSVVIWLRKIVELNFRRQKAAIRQFLPIRSDDDMVLDLGCGTGEFAPLFPLNRYLGIDIDGSNIAYASRHYPHRFMVADARALPFSENLFSTVLVVGVLHHLSFNECQQVIKEIRRVVRPGGRVLIMEDTHSPRLITKVLQAADQGAHIRDYSEWQALLEKDFIIKESGVFNNGACFYSYFLADNTLGYE